VPAPPIDRIERFARLQSADRVTDHWIMRRFRPPGFARSSVRLATTAASLALICGAALALHESQASANRGITQRFAARATMISNFTATYVQQLAAREQLVASQSLTGRHPTELFNDIVRGFGFPAALLIDSHGRDIAISPSAPRLVGTQLAARYPHLTAALHGSIGISNVVVSAARAAPVIAFAVPFDTPSGRRVLSGAYAITDTPLAAYLRNATTLPGARLYLYDGDGVIFATNSSHGTGVTTLRKFAPSLANAASQSDNGSFDSNSGSEIYSRVAVPDTPWSLVIAAPTASVFATTRGSTHWVPWLIFGLLSLLVLAVAILTIRLLESRGRLADANRQLAEIARTDPLTGLSNRRSLIEQLDVILANASRHQFPVCVLMIDVDHFKRINDTYGHRAGDQAIRHVAGLLAAHRREGDLLARWGGEEFLAVLPYSKLRDGLNAARRLCQLVEAASLELESGSEPLTMRVSIGVALAGDDSTDALIDRADLGLYDAKAAGRNTVRTVDPLEVGDAGGEVGEKSPRPATAGHPD
jgi:diguanylate cyclase (GGDEF)-like protein